MVSVIVPVYNVKEFLPNTVASIRNQTERDIEIILVDDGSTDGSTALCDQFAEEDSRIRVIHKENGGLSSARNAGLDAALGAFILFVDGDDYIAPNTIQLLLEVLQKQPDSDPIDFVQFLYQEVSDSNWRPQSQASTVSMCSGTEDMFRYLYQLGGVGASACTKLFRRELFQTLRFRPGIRHEDEEFMTRLLPICHCALYTQLTLYAYVMRPGSIIHSDFNPGSMDIFPVMDERVQSLTQLGLCDLVAETHRRCFQTAAWLYCRARRGGFSAESKALRERLSALSKHKGLELRGQYAVLYRLAKLTPAAPEIYYQFRRLCGKS